MARKIDGDQHTHKLKPSLLWVQVKEKKKGGQRRAQLCRESLPCARRYFDRCF